LSHFREDLYASEGEFQADPAHKEPVKRPGLALAVCLLLALIGAGSAFLWHSAYSGSIAAAAAKEEEISHLLQGLQQSQQGTAAEVRRNQEIFQAQQADIKRLSDEVSQLAAKLELIQGTAREAQAAAPPIHKPPPKKPAPKRVVHEPEPSAPATLTPEQRQ
jgi:uncharacterized protein HemX